MHNNIRFANQKTFSDSVSHRLPQYHSHSSSSITENNKEDRISQYIHSLHYLEPNPSSPPSYISANPNPTVRYPVYDIQRNALVEDQLPDYTPAVSGITLVIRKIELLSPYEVSASRNWRNLVMEINSTQLNFYTIDNLPFLGRIPSHRKKRGVYYFTEFEQHLILETITKNRDHYLTPRRLVRSYSLQMAKFGLPVDYKKKNYCLRVRLETEQMLLKFVSLNDLLAWSNNLSIGINVSLDLSQRELPKDKTVPRRRRGRRRRRDRSHSDPEVIGPLTLIDINGDGSMNQARRSSVAVTTSSTIHREVSNLNGSKNIKSKLFGRFFRSKSTSSGSSHTTSNFAINAVTSIHHRDEPVDIDQLVRNFVDLNLKSYEMSQHHNASAIAEVQDHFEEEEEEAVVEEDEYNELLDRGFNILPSTNDFQCHGPSSSNSADEDSDSDDESLLSSSVSNEILKDWKPSYKPITQKKLYKDALRCLNLLTHNDNWVGKTVIRFDKGLYCNVDTRALKDKKLRVYIVGPHGFIPVA